MPDIDSVPISIVSQSPTPSTSLAPGVSTPAADPMLIAAKRFAELMAVSLATFNRMKAAGKLPRPIELSRGCHRWRLAEVRAWIEAGCPPIREWEARRRAGR
jgi:predicted DNA-binding transcriptional regulator AlpA